MDESSEDLDQKPARQTCNTGNISEAKVLTLLLELGYKVSIPFGVGCSYDCVIDDGTNLQRLQVKTGRLRNGCIHFAAWSHNGSRGNHLKKRYTDRADLFAVYCPDNNKVYLVPVKDVGLNGLLRIDVPRNGNVKRIRWAESYEVIASAA